MGLGHTSSMKRGMSPLLATVLLIAFAVSLGALVMSVGRQMHDQDTFDINVPSDRSDLKK